MTIRTKSLLHCLRPLAAAATAFSTLWQRHGPMMLGPFRLLLLFVIGLAGGAGLLANPLRSDKKVEEKRTAATAPQTQTETPKSRSDKNALTDLYGDPLPSGAIARLGTVRFRHGDRLGDIFLSSDGRTLISVGDHNVAFWDAHSGRRQRQVILSHSSYRVIGMDLSPDGRLLAVPILGNKLRFWDLTSGSEVHPLGNDAPNVLRAVFSPQGELLATHDGANQKTISIWDMRKGKKIRSMEGGDRQTTQVRSLAFSPRGNLLAFPRGTGVCVWDVAAGRELHQLEPGTKALMGCVAFSADGRLLAAAGNLFPRQQNQDHSIHLWDVATGKEVGALKGHTGSVMALAMSPKSSLLASASLDGTIRFWDVATRLELGRSPGLARRFMALAFSADGSVLASGEFGGVLRLWDARKHEEIVIPAAGGNPVRWVRFAPDGQTIISTAMGQLGLWEPLTGRPRRLVNNNDLLALKPALSPDGKILAVRSQPDRGRHSMLWDIAAGTPVRKFGADGQLPILSLTFSPDGRRVAGASYNQDVIHVWDATSGKELQPLKGQSNPCFLTFAPDGATLASASFNPRDGEVRLWKLATREEIWRKETRFGVAFDLKFAPDGRTLAVVGGTIGRPDTPGEVHLWEAATGKELKRFEGHHEHVRCVAFSVDGRMLATGGEDHTVRLWEVASGRERQCLRGHQSLILAVSFSPDGRLLASGSTDTTALVWDLTGRFRDGRFQPRRLSAEEMQHCWNDLALTDAARAYRSITSLSGSPKNTITFLKDHLPPLTAADPKRVAPLLASLDSEQFAERDKAMNELEKMGIAVEPALRKALAAKPSLEVRQRIESVLEKLAAGPRLRFLRALEVLEQIATPEAKLILEALSHGSAELWPTQEAKASLTRLAARPAGRP